ncbi:hypothetical protein, partial [Sutterella wadsworthensis]|uniref:hypothetical protein n=1 Tax=Sutterella wadsworthensis TaxID=40545 RepID=UPI003AF501E2
SRTLGREAKLLRMRFFSVNEYDMDTPFDSMDEPGSQNLMRRMRKDAEKPLGTSDLESESARQRNY